MTPTEYDKVATDFYSQLFMDVATGKTVLKQGQTVGAIFKDFITQFNRDLAAPLLVSMDEQLPTMGLRMKHAPSHYWKSEQAQEFLYKTLYRLLDNTFTEKEVLQDKSRDNPFKHDNFGYYLETVLKLNTEQHYVNHYLDSITSIVKVVTEDMQAIRSNPHSSSERIAYIGEVAQRMDTLNHYFQDKSQENYADDRIKAVYHLLGEFFDVTLKNYLDANTDRTSEKNAAPKMK
jgi:hypothetical protein